MMARTIAYHAYHSLSIAITSYHYLSPPIITYPAYLFPSPQPLPNKKVPRPHFLWTGNQKAGSSYSPALHCSTIGADGLNFSVRNGKRWDTAATATKNNE